MSGKYKRMEGHDDAIVINWHMINWWRCSEGWVRGLDWSGELISEGNIFHLGTMVDGSGGSIWICQPKYGTTLFSFSPLIPHLNSPLKDRERKRMPLFSLHLLYGLIRTYPLDRRYIMLAPWWILLLLYC